MGLLDQMPETEDKEVIALSQDSFYRELEPHEKILADQGLFNFDHPDAFDSDLMLEVLRVKIFEHRRNTCMCRY